MESDGYIRIGICGEIHQAHILAWFYMTGNWPDTDLDHKDRNKANNRWGNIRQASRLENNRNVGITSANKSGFKGVSWDSSAKKWRARTTVKRKKIHLGLYTEAEKASEAYNNFCKSQYGDFYYQGALT